MTAKRSKGLLCGAVRPQTHRCRVAPGHGLHGIGRKSRAVICAPNKWRVLALGQQGLKRNLPVLQSHR